MTSEESAGLRFIAMPTGIARAYQSGEPDAYGRPPERRISDGDGVPCRHCLTDVAAGDEYLILAYRPFPELQPYAETGPIFLHAAQCERHVEAGDTPDMLLNCEHMLIRGYGDDDRIRYGTGQVIRTEETAEIAARLLERPDVAYLHLRSASNNCFQFRIDRAR